MVFCICRGVRREGGISLEGRLPTLTANAVNISLWQVLSWRRNHIRLSFFPRHPCTLFIWLFIWLTPPLFFEHLDHIQCVCESDWFLQTQANSITLCLSQILVFTCLRPPCVHAPFHPWALCPNVSMNGGQPSVEGSQTAACSRSQTNRTSYAEDILLAPFPPLPRHTWCPIHWFGCIFVLPGWMKFCI